MKSVRCSRSLQPEMERAGSEGWGQDVKLDHFKVLQRKSLLAGVVCILEVKAWGPRERT